MGTDSPICHTMLASSTARKMFMIGPANATMIFEAGGAGGSSPAELPVLPSMASIGDICGRAT